MGKTIWNLQPGVTRFGRGVVISEMRRLDTRGKATRWVQLLCDCGTIYEVRLTDLTKTRKPTQSCGCLMREVAAETMRRPENLARLASHNEAKRGTKAPVVPRVPATLHARSRRMAGHRNHPLYGTWSNMMTRCYNPNYKQFKDYGGRGIEVDERWKDPRLFIEDIERDIGPRPPGRTLDRVDNNSNYGPGKVKWSTPDEQVRNSRRYIDGNRSGSMYGLWWGLLHKRKGIVCERWHDFPSFVKDVEAELGLKPAGAIFIRLDDTQPYGPGNVAWLPGARGKIEH